MLYSKGPKGTLKSNQTDLYLLSHGQVTPLVTLSEGTLKSILPAHVHSASSIYLIIVS